MRGTVGPVAVVAAVIAIGSHSSSTAQIGALSIDCKASGSNHRTGTYQFVATCAGRAESPDRRLSIVQRAYVEKQPVIELQDAQHRILAGIPGLSDDMPFVVLWSPNSRWIAVNHHVGSFMDRLQLFEIVGKRLFERHALLKAVSKVATSRYPCLTPAAVLPSAMRWTEDGRRLVIVTVSSPYACSSSAEPGGWWPLWMIGDVRIGRIDPLSVRVDKAEGSLREPSDALYRHP